MFEFHGWAAIRYHTHDTNQNKQDACWFAVERYVQKLNEPGRIWLSRQNASDSLALSGLHNHKQAYPIDLFRWVAAHAPGSYGLLYAHDDEHESYDNVFRVWRLCRGMLEERDDPLLSPYVPTVEDEFDPTRDD